METDSPAADTHSTFYSQPSTQHNHLKKTKTILVSPRQFEVFCYSHMPQWECDHYIIIIQTQELQDVANSY